MDEFLGDTMTSQKFSPDTAHLRLLAAALEFLAIALRAQPVGRPIDDPSASIANYSLAARALRHSGHAMTPDLVREQLTAFARSLEMLRDEGFSTRAQHNLPSVQEFFRQVFANADAESYSAVLDDPSMPTP